MSELELWLESHAEVPPEMFETNYKLAHGEGEWEWVCGFCLASHYYSAEATPERCAFCKAPLEDTVVISNFPEVAGQMWRKVELRDN